ncbi:MAG: hypothetical protein ABSB99_08330 [Acidimicrobiales bacterium]
MSGRSAIDRPPPSTIGKAGQQELLLYARQRNADSVARSQRNRSKVGDQLGKLVVAERLGGCCHRRRWRCLVGGLDDDGPRAVTAKGSNEAERVVGSEAKILSDRTSGFTFGQKPVEEGPDYPAPELLRRNGQGEG